MVLLLPLILFVVVQNTTIFRDGNSFTCSEQSDGERWNEPCQHPECELSSNCASNPSLCMEYLCMFILQCTNPITLMINCFFFNRFVVRIGKLHPCTCALGISYYFLCEINCYCICIVELVFTVLKP